MRIDVALWRAVPLRGAGRIVVANLRRRARRGQIIAVGPRGIRLLVDPCNPPELSIYLWGTYEPEVTAALERVLQPGCTAVDTGANCGVLSILMRRLVGPEGRVVAVDPSPAACQRIREQAAVNEMSGITVIEAGLAGSARREPFGTGRVGIGMLPDVDAQFTFADRVEVGLVRLDDVIGELDLPPVGLIKIDTDGSEPDVLSGARDVLRRDRPVLVMEVFGEGLHRRGHDPAAIAELLEAHEYDLFVADVRSVKGWSVAPAQILRFRAAPLNALAQGTIDEQNVVAISRHDRRAREALLTAPLPR